MLIDADLEPWQYQYFRWITESKIDSWRKTNYLNAHVDKHEAVTTALILENQRLYNDFGSTEQSTKDFFLEVIAATVPYLLTNRIVSVQPKMGPNSEVYYQRWKVDNDGISEGVDSCPNAAKTRNLKVTASEKEKHPFCHQFSSDIDREVLTDLWNNAGTAVVFKNMPSEETFKSKLDELINTIHKKALYPPTWIVATPTVVKKYEEVFIALSNKLNIFVNESMTADKLLIGYKGERFYQSPYIWSPYILLGKTARIIDPDSFEPKYGYIMRYGKYLTRSGAKFYGKILFGNEA